MKGTPQQPMCGFSMRVVQKLHAHGTCFAAAIAMSTAQCEALGPIGFSYPLPPSD